MKIQSPKEWKDGLTQNSNKVQSPSEWLKTAPEYKPTLGQKVAKGTGQVAKAIVSPVVTTVARPFQAVSALAGGDLDKIDKFNLGGLIAPIPRSNEDLKKDVGRAIQTAAFALPTGKIATRLGGGLAAKSATFGAEGAIFGAGASLEEGNELFSSETAKTVGLTTGIGAVLPIIGAGISKTFGKTARKVPEVIPETQIEKPLEKTVARQVEEVIPEYKTKIPKRAEVSKSPELITKENQALDDLILDSTKIFDEKIKTDPVFKESTYKQYRIDTDNLVAANGIDDTIDIVMGKKPNTTTTPTTAIAELLKTNPNLTKAQKVRLANTFPKSKAGAELGGININKPIIDDPIEFARIQNQKLKSNIEKSIKNKSITRETVVKWLDSIQCTL